RGTLWTWTVQAFPPKAPPYAGDDAPEVFQPFGVGYVDIDSKLLVETRITLANPDDLEIGMELELVVEPLFVNDGGDEVVTFAFGPVHSSEGAADSVQKAGV
ncbi:MAG: Zn-ribbon domain-containing OB-fold protein, partial [Microthrixaceae bacterium]